MLGRTATVMIGEYDLLYTHRHVSDMMSSFSLMTVWYNCTCRLYEFSNSSRSCLYLSDSSARARRVRIIESNPCVMWGLTAAEAVVSQINSTDSEIEKPHDLNSHIKRVDLSTLVKSAMLAITPAVCGSVVATVSAT